MNPYAMSDHRDHGSFLLRSGFADVDNVITSQCSKQSHGCSCLWNLPNPACGTYTSTRRNPPEPASGTYTSMRRNSPEFAGTFRNLPLEPTPAPELPGTLQHSPELSGTLRNLPLEPTPAHTRTLRNFRNLSPEPSPATRTGTHRSLSGLKTPSAYAVGEKCFQKKNNQLEVKTSSI